MCRYLPIHSAALLLAGLFLAPGVLAQSTHRASDGLLARRSRAAEAVDRPAVERRGGLTIYADRAAFDAANPGLPVEDFEDVAAPQGGWCVSPSPADASTNNSCVSAGDVAEGLAIAAIGINEGQPDALVAWDGGVFSNPTNIFGANWLSDNTELRFDPAVAAAAMDVYPFGEGTLNVEVYDTSDHLLGSTAIAATASAQFVGFSTDAALIGRIYLNLPGDVTFVDDVAFGGSLPTPVEPGPVAAGLHLGAAPNPFRDRTVLAFSLPREGPARLAVYDALGREVAVLVERSVGAGQHEVAFDGSRLPPGAYLVRLTVGDVVRTRVVTLLR